MVKQFLFFVFFIISLAIKAQAPPYIPYQAIARDMSGQVKVNTPIQVQFKIFNTMISSSSSYDEVHSVTTNDFGYFNLRIGSGTIQSGSFSAITWQTGDVSYEVWVDMGLGFSQLGGRSGFLSVPYAMYAANSNPNPTLTINAPNTISNPSLATYSINVPSPTLSITNNSISISNGNTVFLPQYVAGSGISVTGSTITNTAPNQTVNISGQGVSGSYPNYSITPAASGSITSGNSNIIVSGTSPDYTITSSPTLSISADQLSISNGNTITLPGTLVNSGTNIIVNGSSPSYTISAVTPTLTTTGNASITGIYPNQTIDVPTQTLSVSGNTLNLSSGGGSVILPSSPTTTINQGTHVIVNGTAPDYTISAVTPTLTATGNATITGIYPNQTIDVPVTTIEQGSYILVNGASPNYTISAITPTLTPSGNITINGAYPNQTISVPSQTLSISGNTLNLSAGGGSVTLPSSPTTTITQGANITVNGTAPNYTISAATQSTSIAQGTNVIVNGTSPNYTISAVTPTLITNGNIALSGSYPTQTITVVPTSIAQGTNITVIGTSPNYTLSSVTPTVATNGNITLSGSYPTQTLSVPAQTLSISGNTLNLSAGGGSVTLPASWNLSGNAGTSAATNFIGTTDANDFVVKTAGSERLRVTSTGSIGIGTTSPGANFDINSGNVKLGAGSTPFSIIKYGTLSGSFLLSLGNNAGTFSIPGAQVGDVVVVTLNSHNASSGSISLNNAYISSANTLSYNVNTSLGLVVTLNFSYILMRP
ncbi:MAG: hypothetical protein HY062_14095 [Bacteroidetes bacterium]|nr:hypothetical protein [Bacteroidota bacterium]